MANVYVRSGAGGAGTGADWTNAYTTLAAAFTAKAADDTFFVSEDHPETQASAMTLTCPGTNAVPCAILCATHTGTVPPVSADLRTTGTITTTGNNGITFNGSGYYYGVTFNCGTGAVAAIIVVGTLNGYSNTFTACALKKLGTSAHSSAVQFSSGYGQYIVLNNTSINLAASGDGIDFRFGKFYWRNTATPITGTIPTTVFTSGTKGSILLDGLDFSAGGYSASTLFSAGDVFTAGSKLIKNCKLHATLTIAAVPLLLAGADTILINADSSGTNYRHEKYAYNGTQTVETRIVRTGGATDGTTPIAWKIVTTENSEWMFPFDSIPAVIWNDSTASLTATVYGYIDQAGLPNNDEVWCEFSYMGSSGSPISTIVSNTKADFLATAAAQGSDSSTWGGGDTTTRFKMSNTFTPAMKGPIYAVVKVAKASSTFYIDPKIVIT